MWHWVRSSHTLDQVTIDSNSRYVGMTPWLKGSLDSKLTPELGVI